MSASDEPHLLLVNPAAAGGRVGKLLPRARLALERRGIDYRVVTTTGLEQGCAEARAAAAAGERVVVMSGDGMIGQVGGALAEANGTMGLLPAGRGNDLARVLGIPAEVEAAADVLAGGAIREIDVGQLNGKPFLCIASCGLDSDANRIANEAKWIRGQAVYLYAALRALVEWRPATFSLSLDGEPVSFSGYSVAAANSRAYGGGMFIAPDAELDDGLLDVVMSASTSRARFLRTLPKLFRGTHVADASVSVGRDREIRVSADRPLVVYADGDPIGRLPATIGVLPGAVRVLLPA